MADSTRRDFLKTNAALLLGAVGGLASCGEFNPPEPWTKSVRHENAEPQPA